MKLRCISAIISLSVSLAYVNAGTAAHALTPNSADENARETLYVAAYEFPPYYSSNIDAHIIGSVVAALNERQTQYRIQLREVRPDDRYQSLTEQGCCDLMLFESPQWGWQDNAIEPFIVGAELTQGSDLYVSTQDEPLAKMAQRPAIGGMRGYHYQFTGHERNYDVLESEHNLYLADNPTTLLNMLMRGRLDVVMISEEYLQYLRKNDTQVIDSVELYSAVDQSYVTHLLAPQRNESLVYWFEGQLKHMLNDGVLDEIFAEFGLQEHLVFQSSSSP